MDDLKHYVLDFIDTFTNKEIAMFIAEGIVTLHDVEVTLLWNEDGVASCA